MRAVHSGIVDTLIGFRAPEHYRPAGVRASEPRGMAAGYMFKQAPEELQAGADPRMAIKETLDLMDRHGIEWGFLSLSDDRVGQVLKDHPDRFVAGISADGNRGMEAVRDIVRAYEQHDARGVITFPAGVFPAIPINDKLWYPIYAKCVELDLPVFIATGFPGPRIKMMPQYTGHLDEVCYDFPELKIVMRHGAEPWEDLAVKLMLKWPGLYFSTSGFAPKYYPKAVIDYANTRGADKVLYAGYFPHGLELGRIFSELDNVSLREDVWPKFLSANARKLLKLPE